MLIILTVIFQVEIYFSGATWISLQGISIQVQKSQGWDVDLFCISTDLRNEILPQGQERYPKKTVFLTVMQLEEHSVNLSLNF